MPDFWTATGILIGILGILFALVQGVRANQLRKLVHSQAWDFHSRAKNSFGATQSVLRKYREAHSDEINTDLFEDICRSEAFAQDLFLDSIQNVYLSEPFDYEKIASWRDFEKIDDNNVIHFKHIADLSVPILPLHKRIIKSIM